MRTTRPRFAVFAVAALLACSGGSDGPTSPQVPEVPEGPETPEVPGSGDVSLDEALGQLSSLGSYTTAGMAGLGVLPMPGMPAASATDCPYSAGTQFFVCPSHSESGLTVSIRYQLLNGSSAPMPAFDPATIAGIRYVVDVNGAIDAGEGTIINIASHDDQVLSGLQTATRAVNGTGSTDLAMTIDGQNVAMTVTRSINNLVLPSEPGPDAYPLSGSISTAAAVQGVSFTSTVTFNGTSVVTVVTTVDGQTQTCTFDLATPEAPAVCT